MKSYISFATEFFEKRKYQQNEEDSFLLAFAKILFVFIVIFLIWTGYFHYRENNIIKNGFAVEAEVTVTDENAVISFVAEDGMSYQVCLPQTVMVFSQKSGLAHIHEINRKFYPGDGDIVAAYYMDNPEEAIIPSNPIYYVIKYVISFIGFILIALWIKRLKKRT